MRGADRAGLIAATALFVLAPACREEEASRRSAPAKSPAATRAERRAYDGAPPTIPHRSFGVACTSCHNATGVEVPDVGFAPPSPHELTSGMSATSRCPQCHVYVTTTEVFQTSEFVGLAQNLRRGARLYPHAPPVIPHPVFMRENCAACHTGPAAREEIRCSHPERIRCRQCHVPVVVTDEFSRSG